MDLTPDPCARPASRRLLGKALYALLFVALLPAGLVAWSIAIEDVAPGPRVASLPLGVASAALGASAILAGWWALYRHGRGLPMNAFPPPHYVRRGIYRLSAHPIYAGAVLVALGVALAHGSAAALWVVGPLFGLAAAALVLGYERQALAGRFGRLDAGLRRPEAIAAPPRARHRAGFVLHAIVPWAAWLAALALLGEREALAPRACVLGLFLVPSLVSRSRARLALVWTIARRALAADVLAAALLAPADAAGALVRLALALACGTLAGRGWELARRVAERVANSWREWTFGPVRFIVHGAYIAVSTAGGAWLIGALAGEGATAAVALGTVAGVVGAALWAQLVEGSARLLRPFGFYGGVLGICLAGAAAPALGVDPWLFLAAFTVAGPWIQAWGRVRCLVQGCCHGAPAPAAIGIVHTHARSRVVRLSAFAGVALHPTALYSILWNGVVAVVLARAWAEALPLHFIAGLYLYLAGAGRFVEEAHRGEPQTRVVFGLRLYQWLAVGSMLAGALCMALGRSAPAPAPAWGASSLASALALGVVCGAALGVDFPRSNRRFSRLV